MASRHLVHRHTRYQCLGYDPPLRLVQPIPLGCRSRQRLDKPIGLQGAHDGLPMSPPVLISKGNRIAAYGLRGKVGVKTALFFQGAIHATRNVRVFVAVWTPERGQED